MAGLLLALCLSAFAQGGGVKVTVSDDMGPVVGADIMIKGTTTGAMTDLNGSATLPAKEGDVLVISFV